LVVLPKKGSGLYSWALPVTLSGLLKQAQVDTLSIEELAALLKQKRLGNLAGGLPGKWDEAAVRAAADAGQTGREKGYVLVASWNTEEQQEKWNDDTPFWLEAKLRKGDEVRFETRLPQDAARSYRLGDYDAAVRELAGMVIGNVNQGGLADAQGSDVWKQRVVLEQVRLLAEAEQLIAGGKLEDARSRLGQAAAGAKGQEGSILARLRLMEVNEAVRVRDPERGREIGKQGVDEEAEAREDKVSAWARLWNGDCYRLQERWDVAAGKYFWWVRYLVDEKLMQSEEVFPTSLREDLNVHKPAVWARLEGHAAAEAEWWATAAVAVYRGASGELAAPLSKHAEECAKRETDQKARADALVIVADQAGLRSDLDANERLLEAALEIRRRLDPVSLGCAAIYVKLAWFYRVRGNPVAREWTSKAETGDLEATSDLQRAFEYSQSAASLYGRLAPDTLEFARALNVEGAVLKDMGDLDRALEYYKKALALRERLAAGSVDCARSYNNIGNVYLDRGDLVRALEWHQKALALYERLEPGSADCAGSYNNLGLICHKRGDLKSALEWFEKAVAIEERLAPGSLECARAYSNLADACHDKGDEARASELRARAQAIRDRLAPHSAPRPQSRGL
jgi:tetratricopeptide (TPR) repeat protein